MKYTDALATARSAAARHGGARLVGLRVHRHFVDFLVMPADMYEKIKDAAFYDVAPIVTAYPDGRVEANPAAVAMPPLPQLES